MRRRWGILLATVVLTLLSRFGVAVAVDGDVVEAIAGPVLGTFSQTWKLIDGAGAVDNGQWVSFVGFTTGSVEVTGVSGDTLTLNCTNGSKPANSAAGTVLTTITTNNYFPVTQPCRFIKAAVTVRVSGTAISAILTASPSGGGGGGTSNVTVASAVTIADGITGPVKVTPASTAAVAADKALVVAISPNSAPPCQKTSGGVDTSDTVLGTCKTTIANAVSLTAPTLSTTDPYTSRVGLRITTSTTTQILAGVAATRIRIFGGSVCVDAAGVQTTVTLEDSSTAPIDIFSNTTTLIPYQLSPGQCLSLTPSAVGTFTGNPTTTGKDLQIVTGQNGPINVVLYLRRE